MNKMNKILNGYKAYVMTNRKVKTVKTVNEDDLKDINNLKELLLSKDIYSTIAYDNYINWLCDNFKIECCFTCGDYCFLKDLQCCDGCNEYICNDCKPCCICMDGLPDEDEDEEEYKTDFNCYYV